MAVTWTNIQNGAPLGDGSDEGGTGTFRGEINKFNTDVERALNLNTVVADTYVDAVRILKESIVRLDMENVKAEIAGSTLYLRTDSISEATNDIASLLNVITSDSALTTADIATSTADIAANTVDIDVNRTAIATNTSDIAVNTFDIDANRADIAANTVDITTNRNNITTNRTNLEELKTVVSNSSLREQIYLYNEIITPLTNSGSTSQLITAVPILDAPAGTYQISSRFSAGSNTSVLLSIGDTAEVIAYGGTATDVKPYIHSGGPIVVGLSFARTNTVNTADMYEPTNAPSATISRASLIVERKL